MFFPFFPDELEYIEAPVAAYAFGFRTFVPCLVRQPLLRLLWTLFPRAFALVLLFLPILEEPLLLRLLFLLDFGVERPRFPMISPQDSGSFDQNSMHTGLHLHILLDR